MGWGDRFKEKMRQGTHISKDLHHFKGTDNDRVKNMLKEADDFASRLKSFKKHITENSAAISGLIKSTQKACAVPLPRVYEREPETGNAAPSPSSPRGQMAYSIRVNDLTAIEQRMESDLKTDVFSPINGWLDVHKEFASKLTQLEKRRLEFDNARRMHGRAELERVRSLQKHDRVEQEVAAKLDTQLADSDAKRVAFTQYENEVHAQLSGLIMDAANMHSVFAAAYQILGSTLNSVVVPGAPRLTRDQLSGAPNAMREIEHQMHRTDLSGRPASPRQPGIVNVGPLHPGGSGAFGPPPPGSINYPPPVQFSSHPPLAVQPGNYGSPMRTTGNPNPFL